MKRKLYLTFDVEPFWATIPCSYSRSAWDELTDHSPKYTKDFINFCQVNNYSATFFIVGEWARRHQEIVKEISEHKNFEIGSHSLWHEDLSLKNDHDFITDVKTSKEIIEDISGKAIRRFRAPSFSLRHDQLRLLTRCGIDIDSSCTSARRLYGGSFKPEPGLNTLKEVPFEGFKVLGQEITLLGGGYLRIIPPLILSLLTAKQIGNMLYLHPHDLPQKLNSYRAMSVKANFLRRARVGNMYKKLEILNKNHDFEAL